MSSVFVALCRGQYCGWNKGVCPCVALALKIQDRWALDRSASVSHCDFPTRTHTAQLAPALLPPLPPNIGYISFIILSLLSNLEDASKRVTQGWL